jgi:hypothetical protein
MLSGAMSAVNRAESGTLSVLAPAQRSAFVKGLSAYAAALDKMEEGGAKRGGKKKAAKKKAGKRKAKRR